MGRGSSSDNIKMVDQSKLPKVHPLSMSDFQEKPMNQHRIGSGVDLSYSSGGDMELTLNNS
jgi:hypothetical protein